MTRHIDVLGILFILWGLFQLLIAVVVFGLYGGFGALFGVIGVAENEPEMLISAGVMGFFGILVGCLVGLLAVPNLFAGIGIRRRRRWGRIMGLIFGALALTSFPFGTALGVYALIVLLDKEVGEVFDVAKEAA